MKIHFTTPSSIEVSIFWKGTFVVESALVFFSKDSADIDRAADIHAMFPEFFDVSFGSESGVDTVSVKVKDISLTISNR